MSHSEPDYKLLYEQSQQELARAEQQLAQMETQAEKKISGLEQKLSHSEQQLSLTEQKLQLALLEINELRAKLFGSKSDKRVKKAAGKELDALPLGATSAEVATSEALLKEEVAAVNQGGQKAAEKRAKTPTTRMVLPLHLEREEVIIDPEGDLSTYQIIGEEITEVLVLLPASFKVKRIIRRKWALKNNHNLESKGVLIAPIPSRTVKRGLFDESLLAYLLISKYIDHLPLYRQKKIFERQGITIPPSTLNDNTAAACGVLKPLYHALKRELLANLYLQADETGIKILESEKKGACHLGYYWVYHAPVDGLVVFDYRQGRGQAGPKEMLSHFSGVLQSDSYGVYQALFKNSDKVNQLYCMAHIRRKFDEAVNYDKDRATYAVESIGELYAIEKHIREASPPLGEDEIVVLRRKRATPILDQIKEWLLAEYPKVLPQSPIGKAIAYALPLWDKMYSYTLHGHLLIDNNGVENAIRPVALGRKNYLFAGTHHSAQNAAMIYSLFATCHKHEVNPQVWLIDVLHKLNDPQYEGKFSDLLPHRWKNNYA
jgi:transposase